MNLIVEKFNKLKLEFEKETGNDDGVQIMKKIIILINELGQNFNTFNGGELSEIQMKIAGYKFYLADYVADLQRISESLKLEMKEVKAQRWDQITEEIKSKDGKVKNKEQVDNALIVETRELAHKQILYETKFYQYKLKISSIDDILTAIVQRISELKRQIEQTKNL